jgi:hypothetical protein
MVPTGIDPNSIISPAQGIDAEPKAEGADEELAEANGHVEADFVGEFHEEYRLLLEKQPFCQLTKRAARRHSWFQQ